MFNLPKKYRTRPAKSGGLEPFIIKDENLRYHMDAVSGMERPIVMAEIAIIVSPGHGPGENDSIRDGECAPQREFKRVYASLSDWIEAGNPDPRDK